MVAPSHVRIKERPPDLLERNPIFGDIASDVQRVGDGQPDAPDEPRCVVALVADVLEDRSSVRFE